MEAGGIPEQWQEALDPPVDGATVHLYTALCEPLNYIRLAERITHIPTDGETYQVVGEVVT